MADSSSTQVADMRSNPKVAVAVRSKIEKELIKGIVHLARHKEFYGHIVQQLQKVYVSSNDSCKTAGVGRIAGERFIKMYFNVDFFTDILITAGDREKGWTQMLAVIEHEVIHCFPAGTMVSGPFRPIEDLNKGDSIIGSDGQRHKAEHVEARDYSGGLVTIRPMGVIGFDVTDNHLILTADIGWKTINTEKPRRNIRIFKDVSWKNSQDIKKGDWLAIPRMKGSRMDTEIDMSQYMRGNTWSLPAGIKGGKIPLNEDISWLMGFYCAEGSACPIGPRDRGKARGSGQVTFSMNRKEEETHGRKLFDIVEKWSLGQGMFFTRVKDAEGKDTNSSAAVFSSTVMARMLHDKVGRGASNKRIPDEIFWHKDDRIIRAFLRGYFDGDGATKSYLFAAATVSRVLAYQIQMMTTRLGVWMNMFLDELSKKPPKVIVSGPPRFRKDQYRLSSNGDDIRFVLGYEPVKAKNRPTRYFVTTDEFIFVRVRSVSRREWRGKVYNLKSPTMDYLVNNVVVHNCIFGHLFLYFADRTRGNVATDCVVNSLIPKNTLPGEYVHPEHYGFPLNKSAMWYYTHLQDNPEYKKQCADGKLGIGGVLSNVMSGHSKWEDLKDDLVAKEFAKDIVRKAQDLCGKNYGNIPGEIIEQIENLLKKERAIVPWGKVLRMFCASCAESNLDYTVKRISRRFNTRPGTRKEDVLNLAICVDTSGSISDLQLKLFFNEIRWIWKNGAKITVYEADCKVCATYPFKGKFNGKVHGRGGTDLEPALKEVEGRYDAVIYFTDFYAPKIQRQYRIPTLWVLTTELDKNEWPAQWGKHIKIEDGVAKSA